ncbi:MAG TPA: P1 family peptidase [Candidatus Saccharimonadales bacterium]|nr:P1 family peptidase [Candidatus Saccharimonadales bacterium]
MGTRARDLGIVIGLGTPGPENAITDVAGVSVGHVTLIEGDGPLVVGQGPVRTGVTVVCPRGADDWREPVFAGCHRLNGNGELTGLEWIRESGLLTTPIAITNTHSVGIVRDALVAASVRRDRSDAAWSLPVVGETYDGLLNDINGFHVRAEHLHAALEAAAPGPVAEGAVGGGTGMVCHEFKGGIGTASRVLTAESGGYTVGVLVQANYGKRAWLRVDGVRVGEAIPTSEVPSPYEQSRRPAPPPGAGSIIVVVATDAPLLPHQCERLAQRAGLGIARVGGTGGHTSGDLFVAFATGNRLPVGTVIDDDPVGRGTYDVRAVGDIVIDQLFDAVIEATEESIVNALVAGPTVVGRDGVTAHAIPHDRLREVLVAAGRIAAG